MVRQLLAVGLIAGCLFAPAAAPAATPCCDGDCNGDGVVRVNEVIAMINIALGGEQPGACDKGACPCSGPDPGEICEFSRPIRAIKNALDGCLR